MNRYGTVTEQKITIPTLFQIDKPPFSWLN